MGVFLSTAAYSQNISNVVAFCTATTQSVGYTYYYVKSFVDASIPQWTIRVLSSLTGSLNGSGNGIGCYLFSCNAQYSTASYGGAQANSNVSTRSTNGTIRAYGLGGIITAFSSESCYVDSLDSLSGYPECSRLYSCAYGSNTANKANILKDTTKYLSSWATSGNNPVWGNQPWQGNCATYTVSSNYSHQFISCSNNTAYTSSTADTQCAYDYQYLGTAAVLSITNYYTGSCGTHS